MLTGFFLETQQHKMSSAVTNDVKTAVPIFDGSNYNVWVDQMKFWLQSQNLWRIVNGTILRPTVGPGPPPQSLHKTLRSGTTRTRLPLAPYPSGSPTICGLPFSQQPTLLPLWCGPPLPQPGPELAFLPFIRTIRPPFISGSACPTLRKISPVYRPILSVCQQITL